VFFGDAGIPITDMLHVFVAISFKLFMPVNEVAEVPEDPNNVRFQKEKCPV